MMDATEYQDRDAIALLVPPHAPLSAVVGALESAVQLLTLYAALNPSQTLGAGAGADDPRDDHGRLVIPGPMLTAPTPDATDAAPVPQVFLDAFDGDAFDGGA